MKAVNGTIKTYEAQLLPILQHSISFPIFFTFLHITQLYPLQFVFSSQNNLQPNLLKIILDSHLVEKSANLTVRQAEI